MLKRIAALFIATTILTLSCITAYAMHNDEFWADSQLHILLESGEVSNSSLESAFVNVKYDFDANRIYMLLMLNFDDYNVEDKSSVRFTLNDIGKIDVDVSGICECDTELFYAQADVLPDSNSCTQLFDLTIGIKQGIPDDVVLKLSSVDSFGIRSNDMEIDITPETEIDDALQETEAVKTTKVKTTKIKTTKVKTTKRKTAKTQKSETNKNDEPDEAEAVLDDYDIEVDDDNKRTAIILGSVAAATVALTGCTVALIRKNKKDEHEN